MTTPLHLKKPLDVKGCPQCLGIKVVSVFFYSSHVNRDKDGFGEQIRIKFLCFTASIRIVYSYRPLAGVDLLFFNLEGTRSRFSAKEMAR